MIERSTLPSSPPANDVGPLPASALQQLSGRLGARTLARARLYDAWRAVYDGQVRGAAVKARCEGSQGEAWRVSLRVDREGCVSARCSCPVGAEGDCKHVGAALLAWRARPQRFARALSVHDCLDAMDAPALRAMLRELAARSEELEWLVESLLPEVPAPPTEGWGERVGEAFRHRGAGPGAGGGNSLLPPSVAALDWHSSRPPCTWRWMQQGSGAEVGSQVNDSARAGATRGTHTHTRTA